MEPEQKEKPIPKADLSKIQNPILKEMIEARLIDEQGIRIQGMGILIRKAEKIIELQDKTNLKLHFVEKAIRGETKQ